MMKSVFLIIWDSFGIGEMEDAAGQPLPTYPNGFLNEMPEFAGTTML